MLKNFVKKISPRFFVSCYHFCWAFLGAMVFGFPSRKIKVIGITGTNGKTTTANLIADILEEGGYKVAVASSIKFKIGKEEQENKLKMTMPGRAVLQKFLREAVKAGCQYAIIEATSEGTLQYRQRFINWQTMVFTNLSPEHIERHKGFENYKKAKGQYFKICKGTHIINADDANSEYFLQFPSKQKFCYGLKNPNVKIARGENVREEKDGLYFDIENKNFYLPLIGKFNVYNCLAAICVGLSQNVSLEICQKALANSGGAPGRMEEVIKEPFRVIVDYAFTPNALEQVYSTLRKSTSQLVCVLGACGGGRDKWKRPVLGQIAAKHCDEILITNEDPYDENPMEIIHQVAEGAQGTEFLVRKEFGSFHPPLKILDRREAIRKALELAEPNDTVIITGKGSEPWLCVENGKKIPWDDRAIVREEFAKIPRK